MAKNIDRIHRIKHQNKPPKDYLFPTDKQQREALMALTVENYGKMLEFGMQPIKDTSLVWIIKRLQNRRFITPDEAETLLKMNSAPLNEDKLMAFTITQQKYREYKNRFKLKPK